VKQVVNAHLGEAIQDRKKPEATRVEAIRTNGESAALGRKFLKIVEAG
jgi:hypothetical protein